MLTRVTSDNKKLTSAQETEFETARLHNRSHLFVQAPHNVLKDVIAKQPGMTLKDISHLAPTCTRFYNLFQPVVDQAGIKKLLQHIAYGEQAEAEKMIAASPHLLMMSADVVDYSHRKIINVTPAQLAFGGDDVKMCQIIKAKLGEAEFVKQIDARFPEDIDAEEGALEEFRGFLYQLVAAINTMHANIHDELKHVAHESPIRKLLDDFRAKFAPGEVRSGKHFDVRFLVMAYREYDVHLNPPCWGEERRQLFSIQVIGYLQRLVPAVYVRDPSFIYFPLDADPSNRLGFEHAIDIMSGLAYSLLPMHWELVRDLEISAEHARAELCNLRGNREEAPWCGVM